MNRLRAFFAFVAAHGGGEVSARDLELALVGDGGAVRTALRAEGIVRDAASATTWPCPEAGCAREVRAVPRRRDGRVELVAVCTRAEEACEAVTLDAADLAQSAIAIDALVAALVRALKLLPAAGARERRPHEALLVGRELGAQGRDVYFLQQPRPTLVRALAAEHANSERGARVLVLTARAIDAELRAHVSAPEGRVALEALDDVLGVEDQRLVEVALPASRRLASVAEVANVPTRGAPRARKPVAPPGPRCAALDGLPLVAQWREVTFFDVDDGDQIGVLVAGAPRSRRLSCVDLGLADRARRPTQPFELLRMVCAGNGIFATKRFGTRSNGKRILSELRKALTAAFGIAEDPFHPYSYRAHSWKPKFRALEKKPGEELW